MALGEASRNAITSHGKTTATGNSKIIRREKTKWTAGRSVCPGTSDVLSSSKSTDKVVFPSTQPDLPTPLLLQVPTAVSP
jgi:hypothetical protein